MNILLYTWSVSKSSVAVVSWRINITTEYKHREIPRRHLSICRSLNLIMRIVNNYSPKWR